jgi:uncharacterized membrane protein YeaQ/YmgE (transglycosylase-associated protein family)
MGIIAWILVGLLVGLIAHPLIGAPEPFGLVNKMVAGLGGSLVGGVVGHIFGGAHDTGLHLASLLGSLTGAIVVLFIVSVICRRLMRE